MYNEAMKLLVITQKVDRRDSDLGFFHAWLQKLAGEVEQLTVICLEKGEYDLPANVTILSLGKEIKPNNFLYLKNFYRYIWSYRKQYNGVFVHMNPEYVILGTPVWQILGKKVLLWYTHKAVNWRLRLAELCADKIFTASAESFRLPSAKVEVVGHGIDVSAWPLRSPFIAGTPVKFLWVGRISPVKDLETPLLALQELRKRGISFVLDIVGGAIMKGDRTYEQTIRMLVNKLGLGDVVHWLGAKSHAEMPSLLASHHVFIHTSQTGSIDKIVLEAMAAGLTVFTSSEAYGSFAEHLVRFPANDYKSLAQSIEKNLLSAILEPNLTTREFVALRYDLSRLIKLIVGYFNE